MKFSVFFQLFFSAVIILFGAKGTFSQCSYSIELYDTFGDGWNGGLVSVSVNGTTVLSDLTIINGNGPEMHSFSVNDGDIITTTYVAGQWASENEYTVYNSENVVVFTDGAGNVIPSGGTVGTATCPSCPAVYNVVLSDVGIADALVSWNASGSAVQWNIEWGPAGFVPDGSVDETVTLTQLSFAGLSSGTGYDVYIQSDCGTDGLSTWYGPFSFSTLLCDIAGQCSYTLNMTDAGNSWNGAAITILQNGVSLGSFTVPGGGSNLETVSLCDGANIELYWTTGVYDNETSFELLDPEGAVLFSWSQGNAPGAGLFYSFTSTCVVPTCPAPSNVNALSVLYNSAIIGWTDMGAGTSWEFEFGLSGYTLSGGPYTNTTQETASLSGLADNTTYDFYVRSLCGPGDNSSWTGPFTFTTSINPVSNPTPCDMNLLIPNVGCVDIPVTVSLTGSQLGITAFLTDVNVIIEHTYDWSLVISLISPTGQEVILSSNNGGSGDNYGIIDGTCSSYTNFNLSGIDGPISGGVAPFAGSYIPEENFSAFYDGSSPNGIWILRVCEDQTYGAGAFQFAQLIFDVNGTEAEILSFSVPGETQPTVIDSMNQTIEAWVDWETNITAIVADFTVSPGATAAVSTIPQTSGFTSNNFINPVVYSVTSEDGLLTKDWTVTVNQEPIPQGALCDDPIPMSLPAVNVSGTTQGFGDNYNNTMACSSNFMTGDDIVYEFTVVVDGTLSGSMTSGQSWIGMFILDDCPDAGGACVLKKTSTSNTISFTGEPISAGTYYLVISSYSPPQYIDFTFSLLFNPLTDYTDLAIISPSVMLESCQMTTENIDAALVNIGNTTFITGDTLVLSYQVNQASVVADTVYLQSDLGFLDTLYYTFPQSIDVSSFGVYNVAVWVSCTDDIYHTNDTLWSTYNHSLPQPEIAGGDTILITTAELPYLLEVTGAYALTYWINEFGSQSAVGNAIAAETFGWYFVTVWDSQDCMGADSVFLGNLLNMEQMSTGNSIELYPNPNRGSFTVLFHESQNESGQIEVFDLQGIKIVSEPFNQIQSSEIPVSLESASAGLYVLVVRTDKGLYIRRFIIE